MAWIFGGATLVLVVVFALRSSEARDFVRISERAEPWWLLFAVLLQAATYFPQGEVYRATGRAAGFPLRVGLTCRLSLAKLFVDQAIPSAGLSGTALFARALEKSGMPRRAVMSGVVVDLASHYAAFVVALAGALVIAGQRAEGNPLVFLVSLGFLAFAIAFIVILLELSGRPITRRRTVLKRFSPLRKVLEAVAGADPKLTHSTTLLMETSGYQLGIMLLDAASMWFILLSLGHRAAAGPVFASLVFSTLFRTVGPVPGGLGIFEAASVLTLKLIGVTLPVALSATLLFRGLSFWLPMLPGLWFSRRALGPPPG